MAKESGKVFLDGLDIGTPLTCICCLAHVSGAVATNVRSQSAEVGLALLAPQLDDHPPRSRPAPWILFPREPQ